MQDNMSSTLLDGPPAQNIQSTLIYIAFTSGRKLIPRAEITYCHEKEMVTDFFTNPQGNLFQKLCDHHGT